MKATNQNTSTYKVGDSTVEVSTGNHPETLIPVYSVRTGNKSTVGFGSKQDAIQENLADMELPADKFITFPIISE